MNFPIIQQHSELKQAVSARDIYNFLQPTERFSSWFERQLQYGFVGGQDYLGCEIFNALAKQTLADFLVSIDMAKEISMIQRSDKGRQARQYFIECERKANQQSVMPALPQSFSEALLLAGALQQQIEQDAPKVAHYNKVVDRHTLLTATQVGQKIGMSAIKLNIVLDEIGIYNKAHKRGKAFKQGFIDKGLGEMKQTDMGYSQPLFTLKGEAWVVEKLASEGVI